ncbi:MAG TPA: hypothetical protein VGP08_05620 [Pyrinomonadaceae bacterium]|jgi:hypothetical protein|nr:hypothetical protein [Pyrinomonadaceae bacterium]
MKLTRLPLVILALLAFAAAGIGQKTQGQTPDRNAPAPPNKSPQKSITVETKKGVVIIDVPADGYRKVGQAQIRYFKEPDATEVRDELRVYEGRGQHVNMSLVYTVKGKRVVRPEEVSVGMAFFTDKARAEKLRGFTLEADGKSIAIDGLTVGDVGLDLTAKMYFRNMNGTMPFALFEQLANSAVVKVHVGDLVFEFSKSNREALRDMLKAIEPPAK